VTKATITTASKVYNMAYNAIKPTTCNNTDSLRLNITTIELKIYHKLAKCCRTFIKSDSETLFLVESAGSIPCVTHKFSVSNKFWHKNGWYMQFNNDASGFSIRIHCHWIL